MGGFRSVLGVRKGQSEQGASLQGVHYLEKEDQNAVGGGRRGIGRQEQYHRQGAATGPSVEEQEGPWVSCKTGDSKTRRCGRA